jgi:dTDP-glucose pyrophosphorylase
MMQNNINQNKSANDAIKKLNLLKNSKILFITDDEGCLAGSLTDGDIRRGILKNISLNEPVLKFMNLDTRFIYESKYSIKDIIELRRKKYEVIPILDDQKKIINIIDFNIQKNLLPVDSVIMAGGLGSRLMPLTKDTPKSLLKIGNKSAIEYNIDRLRKFGIKKFHFCLNHMSSKIKNYLNSTYSNQFNNLQFEFILEEFKMGTIGAVSKIKNLKNDYLLISNSDFITTLDYEKFFQDFLDKDADLSMVSIPYSVEVPYGVTTIDTYDNKIVSLEEKPKYTYYCNAGIYLIKKSILGEIPKNEQFDATSFVEKLVKKKFKVISYTTHEYWLDIGSIDDYKKAKKDIGSLKL